MKYRKKPVVIDARQWNGGEYLWLNDYCGKNWTRADAVDYNQSVDDEGVVVFNTAEQAWIHVPVGHWIIRGVEGELYPCKDEVFKRTYEPVSDPSETQGDAE